MVIKAVMWDAFRRMIRGKSLWLLLGVPIGYCLLFGWTYSSNVIREIPMVVYDQDNTATSRALIQAYFDSEKFAIVGQVTSQEEMDHYLKERQALVGLSIPPDFGKHIKLGLGTEMMVVVDGVNLMFTNGVITANQEIAQTFSVGIGQKLVQGWNQPPRQALRTATPVGITVRVMNNATTGYSNFMLPGLGMNALQLSIVLVTCTVLTREYWRRFSWDEGSAGELVGGRVLAYWLAGMLAYGLFLLLIVLCFGVPLRGNLWEILLIGLAFTFAMTNVGLFFSAVAPDDVMAVQLPMLYIMPAFLCSGYSWPDFAMNEFSRKLSMIFPLHYSGDALRDLMVGGYCPDLWWNSGVLFALGGGLYFASAMIFAFRRRKLLAGERECEA